MRERWALYIDIEGFGVKWNDTTMDAFRGINALMQAIFWIGDRYYPEPPDRLFAHQFGDGFLVTSDFPEKYLDRAVIVAIALLRHLLSEGETAKGAIAEGEVSDVQHCYPTEVRRQLDNGNIHFGAGVMTVSPVLGSALINAVKVQKRSPTGPLLTISREHASRLSAIPSHLVMSDSDPMVINWLRGEPPGLASLQAASGLARSSEPERVSQLKQYIASNAFLKPAWKDGATQYLLSTGA
jgi:hypothetical protein